LDLCQNTQHLSAAANIIETTDPNVEKVTTFNKEVTYLSGYNGVIGREKAWQISPPWTTSSESPKPSDHSSGILWQVPKSPITGALLSQFDKVLERLAFDGM
jgi:hypothetical protein